MSSLILGLILLAIMAWAAISGYRIGLFRQLGSIVGLVVAALACRLFGAQVAEAFIDEGASADDIAGTTLLVYVVLYLVVYFAIYFLGALMRSLLTTLKLGPLDKMLGSILRVLIWLVLISLFLNFMNALIPKMPYYDNPLVSAMLSLGRMVMGTNPAELLQKLM